MAAVSKTRAGASDGSRTARKVRGLVPAAITVLACCTQAIADPVPATMLGRWAKDGRCSVRSERLEITARAATFGTGKPADIVYFPNDHAGHGAVHWVQEGIASNMEYVADRDVVLLHGAGWGTSGKVYRRCTQLGPIAEPEQK